jgi:hypothetical protein
MQLTWKKPCSYSFTCVQLCHWYDNPFCQTHHRLCKVLLPSLQQLKRFFLKSPLGHLLGRPGNDPLALQSEKAGMQENHHINYAILERQSVSS